MVFALAYPPNRSQCQWFHGQNEQERTRRSEAGAAEDGAGAGVDVDPHDLRPAHELEAVAAGDGVELGAEIGEATHLGHDAVLDVAQRQEAALLLALERLVLLALVRARGKVRDRRGGGREGGEEQEGTRHGYSF